ncbi:MAG: hypothetical protein JW706_05070 [Opitutales bacterium]|nr:hypothetical protein [Opitutales bacterium]
MNKIHIVQLPILIAITLLAACNPPPKSVQNQTADASDKALKSIKAETEETAKAIKDYAHAQRVEFANLMKADINASKQELDQIAIKLKTASATVKAKTEPRIKELREQIAKLEAQLETVKNSDESNWTSVKSGFSNAYDATKKGLNEARQWVSDQIQP